MTSGIIRGIPWTAFETVMVLHKALSSAPPALRTKMLVLWFGASTLALLLPLPESWHSLETHAGMPLDKLAHVLGMFFGALLAHWAGWRPRSNFLICALYAGGMELVQGALGVRSADWGDFLAGLLGLVLGLVLAARVRAQSLGQPRA